MELFKKGKDGGPESTVTGYWLIESKRFISIALLRFSNGSREAFHSHAFNCVSWVLSGLLKEEHLSDGVEHHRPSLRPVFTLKSTFHRVFSEGTTWVFTIRGPWTKRWREFSPRTREFSTLKHGRNVVSRGY